MMIYGLSEVSSGWISPSLLLSNLALPSAFAVFTCFKSIFRPSKVEGNKDSVTLIVTLPDTLKRYNRLNIFYEEYSFQTQGTR